MGIDTTVWQQLWSSWLHPFSMNKSKDQRRPSKNYRQIALFERWGVYDFSFTIEFSSQYKRVFSQLKIDDFCTRLSILFSSLILKSYIINFVHGQFKWKKNYVCNCWSLNILFWTNVDSLLNLTDDSFHKNKIGHIPYSKLSL